MIGSTTVPIRITCSGSVLNASSPLSRYNNSKRSSPVACSKSVGTSPVLPPSPRIIGSGTEKRGREVDSVLTTGNDLVASFGRCRRANIDDDLCLFLWSESICSTRFSGIFLGRIINWIFLISNCSFHDAMNLLAYALVTDACNAGTAAT